VTNSQLYGLSEDHLIAIDSVHKLQPEAAAAFSCMQQAAKEDGVQIEIASSFRGFDRQLAIWNRKFNSETLSCLEPQARIESIMRWSALPGTSRHHWGTDCDLYDPTQLQGATLQLEPWEYEVGGPCAEVFDWLQTHALQFGFYRPYATDLGGVAPEPWHWSYAPLSETCRQAFNADELGQLLATRALLGKELVLPRLLEQVTRYVKTVDPAPQAQVDSGIKQQKQ